LLCCGGLWAGGAGELLDQLLLCDAGALPFKPSPLYEAAGVGGLYVAYDGDAAAAGVGGVYGAYDVGDVPATAPDDTASRYDELIPFPTALGLAPKGEYDGNFAVVVVAVVDTVSRYDEPAMLATAVGFAPTGAYDAGFTVVVVVVAATAAIVLDEAADILSRYEALEAGLLKVFGLYGALTVGFDAAGDILSRYDKAGPELGAKEDAGLIPLTPPFIADCCAAPTFGVTESITFGGEGGEIGLIGIATFS
jgi:hypothetical protein